MQLFYKIILLIIIINSYMCSSAQKRKAVVQGTFYSENKIILKKQIEDWLKKYDPVKYKKVRAIIVPHAGYMYSGEIAASGFAYINPEAKYRNVFIIGRSHSGYFEGASLYSKGFFSNTLGDVEVNSEICEELKKNSIFNHSEDYHLNEHSIEVEIPFLQIRLKNDFKIVPILIGTENQVILDKIATILKKYFVPENLFVISTDLSHYPPFNDAVEADNKTIEAILSLNASNFLNTINDIENSGKYKRLSTAACGGAAVYVMLKIMENESIQLEKIKYANSGNISGEQDRVVGYVSIVAFEKSPQSTTKEDKSEQSEFTITEDEKKLLLQLARNSILSAFKNTPVPELRLPANSNLSKNCGVFVSLYKNGELRGCIGTFRQDMALWKNVIDMAKASAFEDHRFSPVQEDELKDIKIEISVLTPLKKVTSISEIELGRHGIYIKKGYKTGTFLPQVAKNTGWTLEEFLGRCARDKAGIGYYGWKDPDTEIYIYEAIVFGEK
ncbi:MAG: AmmeMemoRadiSam system protein B [Bacteroidales bacterium]|nr:AmmeMemoRadiSam system protein B [Bacteroidales bacterium]